MRDFPSLKLLDRFEKVFTSFGVDYPIMRKILQVKLIMDRRRVPTIFHKTIANLRSNKKIKIIIFYRYGFTFCSDFFSFLLQLWETITFTK